MPRTKKGSPPTYRLYKRTGDAVVTLDGIDHYLGPFGSPESWQKYNLLIDRWLSWQGPANEPAPPSSAELPLHDFTVSELILAYDRHAETYVRPTEGGEN